MNQVLYQLAASSNQIKSGTIWFTKSYTQNPSIVVFPAAYDISAQIEFNFSVEGITTTKFDYKLQTLWNGIGWALFYWRTTDNSKIEVIYSFNTNMTGVGTKSFTFSHLNPLALYGFVVPINFGQSGDIQFQVDIVTITSTDVIVQVTQNTTNLLSLGFQVILGTEPSFILETPQTLYDMLLDDHQQKMLSFHNNPIQFRNCHLFSLFHKIIPELHLSNFNIKHF